MYGNAVVICFSDEPCCVACGISRALKSLDRLTALHFDQATRPRRATSVRGTAPDVATIGELVHAPAYTVGEDTAVAEIQHVLHAGEPAVAVVDSSASLCGVITSTDLLAAGADWSAADAMSGALAVRASTPLDDVADLMARAHAPHVVVTDPVGQIVGIVTATELARRRSR
jgi:CBS domain-containing protein